MAAGVEDIIGSLEKLSVLELVELTKAIQDKWGVSAAPVAVAAAAGGAPAEAAPVAGEQTAFDVILTGAGEKKIQGIKVVREGTSLGLKGAKDLVAGAPPPVKHGRKQEE